MSTWLLRNWFCAEEVNFRKVLKNSALISSENVSWHLSFLHSHGVLSRLVGAIVPFRRRYGKPFARRSRLLVVFFFCFFWIASMFKSRKSPAGTFSAVVGAALWAFAASTEKKWLFIRLIKIRAFSELSPEPLPLSHWSLYRKHCQNIWRKATVLVFYLWSHSLVSVIAVVTKMRPAGRMWPTIVFCAARGLVLKLLLNPAH